MDELAARHRFHHWELAFADVFAEKGGFDLVLGNRRVGEGGVEGKAACWATAIRSSC